jgi:hypothetical protein
MSQISLIFIAMACFSLMAAVPGEASSFLDNLLKDTPAAKTPASGKQQDPGTIAAGLKEALSIGTEKAVNNVGRVDGYFGNALVKILIPEKLRKITDTLSAVGYKKEVDAFVLSMNRAAENAAPKAGAIFGDAIRQMSIDDARKILGGGDTAATDYFKGKSTGKLTDAFKPVIAKSLDEVGATHSYKNMISKVDNVPFLKKESLDLDTYVTNKSLEGLFTMVGQEEKNIRTNPAARATDLLKSVFGK